MVYGTYNYSFHGACVNQLITGRHHIVPIYANSSQVMAIYLGYTMLYYMFYCGWASEILHQLMVYHG